MMSLTFIIVIGIFDVWGIDFMEPFSNLFGKEYIVMCVDYDSKWVKLIPMRANETRVVIRF